jgi:hypothetical protein
MSKFTEDTFADTDTTTIEAHTPTGAAAAGTWDELSGAGSNAMIFGNAFYVAGGPLYPTVANSTTPPSANYAVGQSVRVFGSMATMYPGLIGRLVDVSNFYRAYYDGANSQWVVDRVVAGSGATIGTSAATLSTGTYAMRFVLNGTTLTLQVNGISVISGSDSTFASAGKTGFIGYSTAGPANFDIDSWYADDDVSLGGGGGGAPAGNNSNLLLLGISGLVVVAPAMWRQRRMNQIAADRDRRRRH